MSGGIDEALVRHIAHLSRLTMTDEQVASMAQELSAIVGYINQLAELDTEEIEATAHALGVHNVFRVDEVGPSYDPDTSLLNAPRREGEFFLVPKVLDTAGGA